jgi:hypothetical protein
MRTKVEHAKHRKHYIYVSDDTWQAIIAHATEKNVAPARLTRDLLQAWVNIFTPWDDSHFVDGLIKIRFVPMPEEPYPDYFYRMGFGEPNRE